MALLGIGGSKSKSSAQSTSEGGSFGFGQDFASSIGGSAGSSFVDPAQAGFLDFLRNQAQGGFGGFQQGQQQFGQQLGGFGQQAGQLGQQAAQFGQQGINNQFLDALGQQAQGRPDLVAAQTGQLGADIGQFFQEQILPGIGREAAGLGQLGGGRQGVAQGIAAGEAQKQFGRGALDIQLADQQRAQQAAAQGGALFNQGIGQGLAGFGQAGGFLGQQGGFAGQSFQSQFEPLAQLAALFGDPTVLQSQFGFDQAQSGGFDISSAFDRSQSTSKSKAGSFNLGFG